MTAPVPVLLVTHPGLGEGMLEAARTILGDAEGVDLVSNAGLGPNELEARIGAWIDEHSGPVLVLTDLGFGSCCQAARRVSRDRPDVGIVAGINLSVLLAVLQSRPHHDLAGLMEHLAGRARGSVETYLGGAPA